MTQGLTRAEIMTWSGRTVIDRDGRKVGQIDDIFYDTRSGEPEWGLVSRGLVRKHESMVPLATLEAIDDKTMRVPFEEKQVMNAPRVKMHGSLSKDEKSALYRHYGLTEDGPGSETRH